MIKSQIVNDYQKYNSDFTVLSNRLADHLRQLIATQSIKIHSIAHRVKSPTSLAGKISQPDRTYQSIYDLTDIVGIRIVTYFEDTIDQIAQLIEHEYKIDFNRSVDKRNHQDFNQFGYRSLHYVAQWPQFSAQQDRPPFQELHFEIQIRSILQHAWAEIEHDLGYKSSDSIPRQIGRKFSQLASLLEIADEAFVSIKQRLKTYESGIDQTLRTEKNQQLTQVSLDRVSLTRFINSTKLNDLDHQIAKKINKSLVNQFFYPDYLVRMLQFVGIQTIGELDRAIKLKTPAIINFIHPYFAFTQQAWGFSEQDLDQYKKGYCLLFLCHILLLEMDQLTINQVERVAKFYQALDYPDNPKTAQKIATMLINSLATQLKTSPT